jgi:hypothetical protein
VNSSVESVPAQQGKTLLDVMASDRETVDPDFAPLYLNEIVVLALRFANRSPSIEK